jgi:glycosyltransferase involved in cell wall biosynthesis
MRILYYCPEYFCRHGGRIHARGFFRALSKLPSVSASFLYPSCAPRENLEKDANSRSFPREKLWFLPYTFRQIVRYFRPEHHLTEKLIDEIIQNRCNVIVIRTGMSLPSLRDIKNACPDTLICLEINSAFFDESFPELPFRSVFQRWEVARFNQADAFLVVSSYLKSYLESRGVSSTNILVNQNGVNAVSIDRTDLNDIKERYGVPNDAFVLGYIGGMETFRRLPEVVRYMAALRRAGNDDIFLIMIGDGSDMPAVQETINAESKHLKDFIKLTGWIDHSEAIRCLAMFDIAIFPFTNPYCSPLKLFEYIGAGVPTVGPDTPTVREVFEDGVHLKLVKQDGSDFINTILEMKADPRLRSELSQNGRRLVLDEYTWEKNAERAVEHLRQCEHGE